MTKHLIAPERIALIFGAATNNNIRSIAHGLDTHGAAVGLDQPHRLAHYLSQIGHESARGRYDREVWDGKGAQARYDTRTDLGNTPEVDGDGKKNRGRTAMMITGGFNNRKFRDWCRARFQNVPDFAANPDLMNTDPWEGLGPIWFWSEHGLNALADAGDIRLVTKRINGGYNGLADRNAIYTRAALVLMDFGPADVREFQRVARIAADGIAGPMTHRAMHAKLLQLPELDAPRSAMARADNPFAAFFAALARLFTKRT